MPLPKASESFTDLDERIKFYGQDRKIIEPIIEPQGTPENINPGQSYENPQIGSSYGGFTPPQRPELTPEAADAEGKMMAEFVDHLLGNGAKLIAYADDSKKYKANPGELKSLSDVCAEIAQRHSFKMAPEWRALGLIAAIYGPKYFEAFNDRRFNIMERENRDRKAENEKLTKETEELRKQVEQMQDQLKTK